jgi:hypothetical protein
LIAGVITAIGACATIGFLLLQWRATGIREAQSEWRTSNLELQAEVAKRDAADALERIAGLNKEAARLSSEAEASRAAIADANARASEAQLALEKFKAPRQLSSAQQSTIAAEMRLFPGTPVVFGAFQDPESTALLQQISDVLISAGWVEQEWKSGGDIVMNRGGDHPIAGYTMVTGVYVQADIKHAADFGPIVQKLAKLISGAGIETKPEVGRMAPDTNNDAVKILIGQKPR